jgi:hypothetical protein
MAGQPPCTSKLRAFLCLQLSTDRRSCTPVQACNGLAAIEGVMQRERQDRFFLPTTLYLPACCTLKTTKPTRSRINLLNLQQLYALEELIATTEAIFSFIRFSELDPGIKNAFYQLEKQFEFHSSLVIKERMKI